MSIRKHLENMVAGMPPGSSVTLAVDWLRGLLEEEANREGDEPAQLLTLAEVAAHVGRAESTVRTWCNGGKLPGSFRLNGRDWRVPAETLSTWLEGQSKAEQTPKGIPSHREASLASWRRHRQREKAA